MPTEIPLRLPLGRSLVTWIHSIQKYYSGQSVVNRVEIFVRLSNGVPYSIVLSQSKIHTVFIHSWPMKLFLYICVLQELQ